MAISLVPASQIDIDKLTEVFNESYVDYSVPIQLSAPQMRHTISTNAINLEISRIAMDGDKAVGMGFLAIRDKQGWIGGMGVIPPYRRQGIGRQIMRALLAGAIDKHLGQVHLEVIEGNEPAYQLYLHLGFKLVRRLLIVQYQHGMNFQTNPNYITHNVPAQDALYHYLDFHTGRNPWQRSSESLQNSHDLTGWITFEGETARAYAVGRITKHMIQLMDIAGLDDEAVAALLADIHLQTPGIPSSMVNLADDDPAWPVMRKLGFNAMLAQLEMLYTP